MGTRQVTATALNASSKLVPGRGRLGVKERVYENQETPVRSATESFN